MRRATRLQTAIAMAAALAGLLAGCFGPQDRRPGMRLRGELVSAPPSDWAFTNDHAEIAIEVRTPYLLPHSVTIWCAAAESELYVGARDPDAKRWPGWVDRDPDVRLGIGSEIYEVRLVPVDGAAQLERVRRAYRAKYELPPTTPEDGPPVRYWRVEPRV